MGKKYLIGTLAVFVVWQITDYLIHGVYLMPAYEATSDLWRTEMNGGLLVLVSLIAAASFVYVYSELIANKSVATALKYGVVFGIGAGASFAYGSYAVMPIPYSMALVWFLTAVGQGALGGYVCSLLVKPDTDAS